MKRILLTQLFVLTLIFGAKAQTYTVPNQNLTNHPRDFDHRNSFWTEFNIQGSISKDKRWQYQIDYQYRRMDDASFVGKGNHIDIFKDPYQRVVRPWIHYWVIPGAVRLSLSPVGYWATWTPPAEGAYNTTAEGNVGKTFYPEIRTCPQITFVNTYGRFQFFNRLRYEFRWIGTRVGAKNNGMQDVTDFNSGAYNFWPGGTPAGYGSAHKGRIRYQVRMQVLLTSKTMQNNTIYLNVWDEFFLGVGRHVGYNGNLDQNRTVALLGWKVPCEYPIRIEAGVTYQQVFNGGNDAGKVAVAGTSNTALVKPAPFTQNVELNMAYTVYVIFDEFHTIFKGLKKKEAESARMLKQMDKN